MTPNVRSRSDQRSPSPVANEPTTAPATIRSSEFAISRIRSRMRLRSSTVNTPALCEFIPKPSVFCFGYGLKCRNLSHDREEVQREPDEYSSGAGERPGDANHGNQLPQCQASQRYSGTEGEIVDAHDPAAHLVGDDHLDQRKHERCRGHDGCAGEEDQDAGEWKP